MLHCIEFFEVFKGWDGSGVGWFISESKRKSYL